MVAIAQSGVAVEIRLGTTYNSIYNSGKTRREKDGVPQIQPGLTFAPEELGIAPDRTFSTKPNTIQIWLNDNKNPGQWATNDTLAHELFGHAYLISQHKPYLHNQVFTSEHKMPKKDDSDCRIHFYEGSVSGWMEQWGVGTN